MIKIPTDTFILTQMIKNYVVLRLPKSSILAITLTLILMACGGDRTTEQTNTDTTSGDTRQQEQLLTFDQYSPKFQEILKTYDGTVRGISLGDPLTEVRQKETAEPLEDSTKYVSYNVELGNNEMTDILYYFDPKTKSIQNITLDIYLNDAPAVDSLMMEFTRYFTDKYGDPVIQEKKAVAWQDVQKNKIIMKDVGIKEAPGLRIQVAK